MTPYQSVVLCSFWALASCIRQTTRSQSHLRQTESVAALNIEQTKSVSVWNSSATLESGKHHHPNDRYGGKPPKCPGAMAGPFWDPNVKMVVDTSHAVCDKTVYNTDCKKQFSNKERVQSIQGALAATRDVLNSKGIPFLLYSGSALGQQRCGDVLPWDSDCDVAIDRKYLDRLAPADLPNDYVLQAKIENIPFVVVDKKTGLYCDIFQMDVVEEEKVVYISWPTGYYLCKQFSTSLASPPKPCVRHDLDAVIPPRPCNIGNVALSCAAHQERVLTDFYGSGWEVPNVDTCSDC